jgi:hypothetical protein
VLVATLVAIALGCATLASPGEGDVDLPNANAGPFRVLRPGELDDSQTTHVAPYLASNSKLLYRDPSALDLDGDPATLAVAVYAASGDAASSNIVRFEAPDGRSLDKSPAKVLEATFAWEGGRVGAPLALAVDGETWLYYEAAGGIGLAKSADGVAFTKQKSPVLADSLGCGGSTSPPGDPGVVRAPDGTFRLFFAPAGAGVLCEAESADGVAWRLASADGVVLRTSAAPDTAPDAGADEPFDDAELASPFATTAATAEGRSIVRVYYAGRNRAGAWAVGMAARFGADGPLERAASPVLANNLDARAPSVVAFRDFSLLYFTENAGSTAALDYPAVAGGVAPATVDLTVP